MRRDGTTAGRHRYLSIILLRIGNIQQFHNVIFLMRMRSSTKCNNWKEVTFNVITRLNLKVNIVKQHFPGYLQAYIESIESFVLQSNKLNKLLQLHQRCIERFVPRR